MTNTNNIETDIKTRSSTKETVVFSKKIKSIGLFELRPINLEEDCVMIHQWVQKDYAIYWEMTNFTLKEVKSAYQNIIEKAQVYIGLYNGEMTFLLECYHPKEDIISKYYNVEEGDKGMHILVAPTEKPITGFTWAVFTTILDFIFKDENTKRIVVEPDARNHKIHQLNKKAGFVFQKVLELPHKKAHLEFCTREGYNHALKAQEKN